jgi:hypothetical protein
MPKDEEILLTFFRDGLNEAYLSFALLRAAAKTTSQIG